MILTTASRRLILWGAAIEGQAIKAELVYFDSNLSPIAIIKTMKGDRTYTVRVPPDLSDRDIPGKALAVSFEITRGLAQNV